MSTGHGFLGRYEHAAETFRLIVDNPDPRYPRNNTYYQVQLARVHLHLIRV